MSMILLFIYCMIIIIKRTENCMSTKGLDLKRFSIKFYADTNRRYDLHENSYFIHGWKLSLHPEEEGDL